MRRAAACVALATAALACATSPHKRAGDPGTVAAALARSRPPAPRGRDLVFLSLGGAAGPRLAAFDLAGKRLVWTQPADVTTRVAVGADVVVHGTATPLGEGAAVVCRDIGNSAVLWQRALAADERLMGYDVDGASVLLVVQQRGLGARPGAALVTALDARSGRERWRHALPSAHAGGAAARGGVVAVLLESQYVVLLDAATGDALGELLSANEAATFVRGLPEGLFYGSRGVFLASASTARGSHQAPGYLAATLPAFVRPFYWYDMYRPEQGEYSAIDRNRVLWRVAVDGDRARFRDGLAFVHHFRFFFAFDAASGALRWAYRHPSGDAVASTDSGGAILFVTSDGDIGALDAHSGARTYAAQLAGETVRGATFDAEAFAPTGAAVAPAPLLTTLASIVGDADRRFPEVKLFAAEQIGRQPGRQATTLLLELLAKQDLPQETVQKAGDALVRRRDADSAELYAAALDGHADYAEGRGAPPVDLLARAVAALGPAGRLAAPQLAAHLLRPETSPPVAVQIAHALAAVHATEATAALRDFLTLYRADPAYDADPGALVAAAEALLALGSAADRELLLFVADEPHSSATLRAHLVRALADTAVAAAGGVPSK